MPTIYRSFNVTFGLTVFAAVLLGLTATVGAADFTAANVGNPQPPGVVTPSGNGFDLTGGGLDIGGTADQFAFNYQQLTGNFDVKVRIAGLSLADAWTKAGLMARDSLNANSPFAASLATPSVSGTFFAARATVSATATRAGNYPVNYPNTWLRLQRSGNSFTGYFGLDGENWAVLGSATLTLSNTLYVGAALSSHTNGVGATAQVRDFALVTNASVAPLTFEVEPAGPSSRRTPIAITEIMYNPASDPNSNVLEFIEIYNSNPHFEDIGGYRISGDIDFTFPANTILQAGEYRVIARNPGDVMTAYGIAGVWGAYSNSLKEAGTVRLRNKEDAILLEVNYDNSPPWPPAADGAGHSLVLARPSYGEGDVRAWGISDNVGGSPGRHDGASSRPQRAVVINEFFANSEPPDQDYVELYNHSNQEVDLSGCSLSDDPHTNKFVLPANTRIQPRSFLVFYQDALGFGLSSGGETIYFRNADGTRVLDAIRFEGQATGVSSGRFPNGANEIYPLTARTPGATNAAILIHEIVINEIMYNPISGLNDDEYVELYNKGATAVNLGGWRFVTGIDYEFPTNVVLAPDAYLVVAKSAARLLTNYPNLSSDNTYGDFTGSLRNRGDRVALARPDVNVTTNSMGQVQTNTVYVVVDEVTYRAGGQWGNWANEGGSSLELIDPRANHRLAYNWADSDETAKAPWTTIQATGAMDLGSGTANFFEILALNAGEWLVDDVEVRPASGGVNSVSATNSNFEGGQGGWLFRGTHISSSIDNTGGFGNNGKCLHVRATARGDSIHNRCLVPITTPSGTVTLRAKVRWLRGWPEMLVRLHGNYMEATGPLPLPSNLGTPGARNSQAISNAPPAIYAVSHAPVVPAASEAVVVTARVHDPDGVSAVSLRYRLDPSVSYTQLAMNDGGTNGDRIAGDGIFSATIPGQAVNALVAYYVQAIDGASPTAGISYPRGASPTTPECVVRFGDPIITSGFGTYRQWMTANYFNIWNNRPALSNERLPVTFVYGNFRAIQFAAVKWAGSPYHQFGGAPNTTGHYSFDIPEDDLFLGTANLNKVHGPGNGPFDDGNIQREQTCYWFARQLGLPWNYRRSVNMYFNGTRPGGPNQLMEDTETPGNDVVESRFPDDPDGNLYKLQPWFEVDDGTARSLGFVNNSWADLTRYTTLSNGVPVQKLARYRHCYLARAVNGSANDYEDVFALKDAADAPSGPTYIAGMEAQCDMEQWMRIFAVHHSVGDWDHFGSQNSQNMYGYKPTRDKWKLMIWDMNIVIGNSGAWAEGQNLFVTTGGGNNMARIYTNAPFRRMYFRALKELCNGAFLPANLSPMLDAKFAAYVASGVSPTSPGNIKSWISTARTSILSTVASEDATTLRITGTNFITTGTNLITITGEAPVEAQTIRVNGIEYPITWTSVKGWTIRVPLTEATNVLALQGYGVRGNVLVNVGTNSYNTNLTAVFTGTVPAPQNFVLFNEIMYNPAIPDASYVELFNTSSNTTFDLGGWRINGLNYTFPAGKIITPRQYLVIAGSAAAYARAYGVAGGVTAGEFSTGNLQNNGETLTLIKPAASSNEVDLVVDRVRYESALPWSTNANGTGSSLQLIDPNQENARVANWFSTYVPPVFGPAISTPSRTNDGWRFVSATGSVGPGIGGGQMRLIMFLGTELGSAIVDDIALVPGTNAAVGANYVRNGDFETSPLLDDPTLTNSWTIGTNYTNTAIINDLTHGGNGALRIHASTFGSTVPRIIWQNLSPAPPGNSTNTLSFWYWATNSSTNLNVRMFNSAAVSVTTNINISITPSNYVPPALLSAATNSLSPGAANQLTTALPTFPPLWINEVQAENISGITDNAGQHDPWIEIYNPSTNAVALEGLFLAPNYTNLTQWAFPPGASIGPTQFLVVFCDGQAAQSSGTEYHTSFRLPAASGAIALSYLYTNSPRVLDYVNYAGLHSDHSYGSFPDGQPFERQEFFHVTPRGTNDGRSAPLSVFVNEWMASNVGALADPADADFDDWFELYNPTTNTVDLAGYFLTDTLTNQFKFEITTNMAHTIAPRGYLLVWADNETGQNLSAGVPRPDLHVNFQLAKTGEVIAIFAADGTQIDAIAFTNQTDDVSVGRFPDGTAGIYPMPGTASPRAANRLSGTANTPPVLDPIGNKTISLGQTLSFTATGHDADLPAQVLGFTLDAGAPAGANIVQNTGAFSWTPGAAGNYSLTVRVTDTGVPPASDSEAIAVTVLSDGSFTGSALRGTNFEMQWATQAGKKYAVEFTANLNAPISWTPLVTNTALGASLTYTNATTSATQRFFRIRVVE